MKLEQKCSFCPTWLYLLCGDFSSLLIQIICIPGGICGAFCACFGKLDDDRLELDGEDVVVSCGGFSCEDFLLPLGDMLCFGDKALLCFSTGGGSHFSEDGWGSGSLLEGGDGTGSEIKTYCRFQNNKEKSLWWL